MAALEGLFAGVVLGAYLSVMERSPTFHLFADVLSALARVLGNRVPEATLARADVASTGWAVYVALHGVAGALAGAFLGRTALGAPGRTALRLLALAAVLCAFDLVLLGAVWRHRLLPFAVGSGLVAAGVAPAVLAAAALGRLAERIPGRTRAVAAVSLPVGVGLVAAAVILAAGRAPAKPAGETVGASIAEATRVPTGVKVVVVALDGLDDVLVDEAIAAGRLPNLAALLRRGIRGDLRSIRPPKSPVVWTSVVTGALPKRHGILDFVVRREGERIPVTSNLRRVPALWNLSAPLDFTVAFVNWYVTWPAEEVAGTIISDRADFDGLPDRVWPPALTAAFDSARAAAAVSPLRDPATFTGDPASLSGWRAEQWGQSHRSLAILDDVVRHDLVTLAGAELALADGQPDLLAAYFRGTDNTQHLFWKHRVAARLGADRAALLYGAIDSTELALLAPVIDRYYDFADELLGRVLERVDAESAVLVVSDHGFLTNNERGSWYGTNRLLAALELAVASDAGRADSAASVVFDPVPPSVDARRVLRAGGVARDPDAALADARARLDGLRTDAGDPVFRSTAVGVDDEGPWLAVVFPPAIRGTRVTTPGGDVPVSAFVEPEGHSGDHRMDGFLLAAGPPFARGRIEGARAVDLAPTIAHLLGVPAARDQEGVVLGGLLDPAWREAHPVRYVETWGEREETPGAAIATDADERIREELRALGYIR